MDRRRPCCERRVYKRRRVQIAFGGRCGAKAHGLVRHLDVPRVTIRVRINGDGCNAQSARGVDHATGDFAAIGDEDFVKHRAVSDMTRDGGCLPPDPQGYLCHKEAMSCVSSVTS